MKICSNCGKTIEAEGSFCPDCGGRLVPWSPTDAEERCPVCGNEVRRGMLFCGECGHSLQSPSDNDDVTVAMNNRQRNFGQQQNPVMTEREYAPSFNPVPPAPTSEPPAKKKTGLIIGIIALSLVVVIGIAAAVLIFLNSLSGKVSEVDSDDDEIVQTQKEYHWEGDYLKDQEGNIILHIDDIEHRDDLYVDREGNLCDADGIVVMTAAQYQEYVNSHKKESTYTVTKSDMDWFDAKTKAWEEGGYLVSINDSEEFRKVCLMAEEAGLSVFWVGAARSYDQAWDSVLWEDGSELTFTPWFRDEPTYESEDGTAEMYLMVFKVNGQWYFNDAESDVSKYYSGKMGYITEIEK